LTLGWKLALQQGDSAELNPEDPYHSMAEFLLRQHFAVSLAPKLEEGAPAIIAKAGACRVLVAAAHPEGSDRETLRGFATPEDTVFVVFRGKIYQEQPTWRTVLDSFWLKFTRQLGLKTQASLPFYIIAGKSCGAEQLPWQQLAV
jgi:hypothetical protein